MYYILISYTIYNLYTLYLHFAFFRHRIAINVTVLRCYGVTVWRVSGGKWRMRGKDPTCVAPSHRRTVA